MATIPTPVEIRDYLFEGYCIDSSLVSDSWIVTMRDKTIIPVFERKCRLSLSGTKQITEYVDGNGRNFIFLKSMNIQSIDSVEYIQFDRTYFVVTDYELIQKEGILKYKSEHAFFPYGTRNIKVVYTVGYGASDIPEDIASAIKFFTASKMLGFLASRAGGGNVSVAGYTTDYGEKGKYTDIRKELETLTFNLIKSHFPLVV